MSIVQSGLLLAVLMPFLLITWIGFGHRHRSTVEQDYTTYTAFEDDPTDQRFDAISDLNAVLRDTVLAVNSLARSKWVRIESALQTPIIVPMNADALRTALDNALRTSIHATPGGQVLVTATMSGTQVCIRITDDGPGTDQQVRETSMRRIEASLAVQGGSILVEARPGRGTTVTIAAPLFSAVDRPVIEPEQLPVLADQAV
jgi:signal transduction histidine kinase